jgi:nucleoside-diphosphate-sugar epimerase
MAAESLVLLAVSSIVEVTVHTRGRAGCYVGVAAILVDIKAEINPINMRYFARTGTCSIEKARRVLGYEPKVDLDEGVVRTQKWLAEQGQL